MATTVERRVPWRTDLATSARWLGAAALAGAVAGGAVGGVGGRLAMLLLRLTSDPSVVGLTSDDGFEIGVLSPASIFLVFLTALLGVIGVLGYLVARGWFPARARPIVAAVAFGVVGGANVVHTDGIDFRVLTPNALTVGLFVALPALYGGAMAVLAERWLAAEKGSAWWFAGLLPIGALAASGTFGVATAAVLVVVWLVQREAPWAAAWWSSPAVGWIGRVALAVFVASAAVELVRETIEIV